MPMSRAAARSPPQAASVAIDATDTSSITAGGGGLAVGVGVRRLRGYRRRPSPRALPSPPTRLRIRCWPTSTTPRVSATGNSVALAATENATILAVTVGGAVAIGVGGMGVAGAAAVGVGNSTNTLENTVEAYLADGATVTTTTSGDVTLKAMDSPNLTAKTVAASVGFAGGAVGRDLYRRRRHRQ